MKSQELVKARLWCLDDDAWSIPLQFNPDSLKLVREGSIGEGDAPRTPFGGPPDWEGGSRDTLEFSTLLDSSVGGEIDLADATAFERMMLAAISPLTEIPNEESVLADAQKYYRLTVPIKPAANQEDFRPPVVAFVWEKFEFMGFVDSLDVDFKLLDHHGKLKRAFLDITLSGRAFTGGLSLEDFLSGKFVHKTGKAYNRTGQTGRLDMADL